MDLNMEELLLSGVHGVYKFSAIRLQLKYGEVEIGPTQKKKKKKGMSNEVDGRGDAADVVLQVYNAFAHEVEIEYQPAVKQEDTQWRFACDGRVLKTVVPYKFWKTYLYPHEQEDSPLEPEEDADPVPSNPSSSSSSAGAFTREIAEYGIAQGNEDLLAPSNGASDVYSWIGRGFMQQHDRRPVLKVMPINEPTKPAHHSHRRTVGFANSTEAGKKNKLRSAMIISPMNGEISEKEIKVQFSRPASTWGAKEIGFPAIESVERVFKVKCYRPSALEDMSEERTKSNEVTRANSTPCTATEEFLEAKFGLHRDRSKDTGLQPLRQYYGPREAVDGAALPVPCLETADVSELMHRRALGYPTSDRATIDVGTSPLPSPRKNGAPVGSDFPMGQAEKGPLYGYGQQYNVLTVGKIVLEEEPDDDARSMWRRRSEGIFAVSVDGINQRKISGDFLKVFFDFLAKERSMFFKRGKQYLGAKSKKLHGPTTGSISCTCFKPAVKDVDDITFAPTGTADVRSVLVPRRMSIWTWNHKKVAE